MQNDKVTLIKLKKNLQNLITRFAKRLSKLKEKPDNNKKKLRISKIKKDLRYQYKHIIIIAKISKLYFNII